MGDQIRWRNVTINHDGGTLRVSGSNIDWQDISSALKQHFGRLRGWDDVVVRYNDNTTRVVRVPRTTFADVAQLAVFWSGELAKAPQSYSQMQGRRDEWNAIVNSVRTLAVGRPAASVFPKNREFWRAAERVAIAIGVEHDNQPQSKLDLVVGFFSDAVGGALGWVGNTLEAGAAAAGRVLGSAARGAADGLGLKPVLIGAGVVAGAAIVIPALARKKGAAS
jgi:hypothetical protein